MPRYNYQRTTHLTIPEVQEMIDQSPDNLLRALTAFLFIFGPRVSEALSLHREDMWIEGDDLAVRLKLSKRRRETGPIELSHVLRANVQTPFMDYVLTWIKDIHVGSLVFPISRSKVWYELKKINRDCSPHFFRHNRLTRLAEKGASNSVVKDWAGWADARMAGRYIATTGRLAAQYSNMIY